jgi:hypothetical protein
MPKLSVPPTIGSGKLLSLVNDYNLLGEEQHVERLFHLQQISYHFQKITPKPELISWRNQIGEEGFEAHLQSYHIHRDSSQLLQNIQFAQAVQHYTEPDTQPETIPKDKLFDAITLKDSLLNESFSEETIQQYIKYNQAIMKNYNADKKLQEKIKRHQKYLGLSYGKIETIQSIVNQQFKDYKTSILGNPAGNNKNFIFEIEGETEKLVIRVEDRNNLGKEQRLQAHVVSTFFSDDYATIMVPFNVDNQIDYRPVVISELATEGDLGRYAKKLIGQTDDEIVFQAQHLFLQLNDFCKQLMNSGHYHPDIKLSNFLTDGERIIVSDRKTIIDQKKPKVSKVSSSPSYAAPEYRACLSESGESLNANAYRTTLDMPSYMAYQMGMALKEFMLTTIKGVDQKKFNEWGPFTKDLEAPNDALKNMDVLIQELTRENPKDRLSIEHAQLLLSQVKTLSQENFMRQLEALSPQILLSTTSGIKLLESALIAEQLTPDLQSQLEKLAASQSLSALCKDPRANLTHLLEGSPLQKINDYLKQVDDQLLAIDLEKANTFEKLLYNIGLGVPSRSSVADLEGTLPKMDEITKLYVSLSDNIPGISPAAQRQLNEIKHCQDKATSATTNSTAGILLQTTTKTSGHNTKEPSMASLEDNGTMLIKDDESLDSGTMLIKDNESIDSGTMLIKDDEGPDSGTMLIKDEQGPDSGTMISKDNETSSANHIKNAVEFMKVNKDAPHSATPKGTDILSTIKQGDKDSSAHAKPNTPPQK